MYKTVIITSSVTDSALYYDFPWALSSIYQAKYFSDFVEGKIYFCKDDVEELIYQC